MIVEELDLLFSNISLTRVDPFNSYFTVYPHYRAGWVFLGMVYTSVKMEYRKGALHCGIPLHTVARFIEMFEDYG